MKSEHEETCALLSTPPISNADRRAIAAIRELSAEVERLKHDLTRSAETNAELATRAERAEAERDALKRQIELAIKDAWEMIDPLNPPPAGSYNMGHHNGVVDALRQVRANYECRLRAEFKGE